MREWSVELALLDESNNEMPLNLVDKVVYHLHPTFNNPNRTFLEKPYKIVEQGWGGFALGISLFLLDKGGERKITHDLNFLKESYITDHVIQVPINQNKVHLLQALKDSGLVLNDDDTSLKRKHAEIESQPTTAVTPLAATTTTTTTIPTEANDTVTSVTSAAETPAVVSNAATKDSTPATTTLAEDVVPFPKTDINTANDAAIHANSTASTPANSVAPEPKSKKSKPRTMVKGSVDIERLAFGLTKLKDDDLVEIVHMITGNITPDMNVTNNVEEGEFTMDLFSLPESLLQDLWNFVMSHIEKKK